MRIAIVAPSPRPFVFGGAERLWLDLTAALNRLTPHEVELIKIAAPEKNLQQVVESYQRFYALEVGDFDAVVVTKYPAWMVQHEQKVVYMQHKLRGLYDTYPAALSTDWRAALSRTEDRDLARLLAHADPDGVAATGLDDGYAAELLQVLEESLQRWPPDDPRRAFPGPVARAVVQALDAWALAPARVRRYAAISHTVARRRGYFPEGVQVHVAHHPSGLTLAPRHEMEDGKPATAGNGTVRFLAVSRLDGAKRLDWVIQAFAQVGGNATLTVVGDGPQAKELHTLAAQVPGVTMAGRLSDDELARCYATHDVAVFAPYEEDMGLVALEAMSSGCPVITTRDSGGVCELVQDGVTGWVVEPKVEALASAMQQATALESGRLQQMGRAAQARASQVDWQGVIAALGLERLPVAPGSAPTQAEPSRPRVVVLAPFGLDEPRGGGANRIFHLYRELGKLGCNVVVICPAHPGGTFRVDENMTVINVPPEPEWQAIAKQWREDLGVPADDVAILAAPDRLLQYRKAVAHWLKGANVAILSHPWALHLLPQPWPVPVVYDAHNVETRMKSAIWARHGKEHAVERAVALTRHAEQTLVRQADLVVAVSSEDAQGLQELSGEAAQRRGVVWVPNGVEPWPPQIPPDQALQKRLRARLWHGRANQEQDKGLALFIGSRHAPNEEGLVHLATHWRGRHPGCNVVIAGSVAQAPEVQAAAKAANWHLLGTISDVKLRRWLLAADFGLNPMLSGGGTNLKVLQYAMAGAVVVSTPYGLRGLPPQHPCPWALTCAIEEFENEMELLMSRPVVRHQLRTQARAIVRQFTWFANANRLADGLKAIGVITC